MKTLYLDCSMGASGDMLTAALLELHPDPNAFVERLNALGLPGVTFEAQKTTRCGITGTHMKVSVYGQEEHEHEHGHAHEHTHGHHDLNEDHGLHEHHGIHEHHSVHDIAQTVSGLTLPESVRADILAVYNLLAGAESRVHGRPMEEIHFHEVGTLDAVADVTAVCLLMHELAPEKVMASSVHVGSGQVRCAHGILPVPAPATALLLEGIPTYGGSIQEELCTPTGAALLRYYVQAFGSQPPMRVTAIGYGCGTKELGQANCVRAMLGEMETQEKPEKSGKSERPEKSEKLSKTRETEAAETETTDTVAELCCNLDDMTPEAVGFATETLLAAGALEVFTTPAGMKKNRPGVLLTCLCHEEQRGEMLRLLFLHTTTLGVRESLCRRYIMKRSVLLRETEYGMLRVKKADGYGAHREKPEYEDIASVAREQGLSLAQAQELLSGENGAELSTF